MSVQVKFRRLGWGALAGLVVVALLQAAPAEAAISAPANLAPTGTVSSNAPVLSWNKVSGAAKYEVMVDNNDDFSSPSFTSTTTNNRAVPTTLLSTGDQYLRVRAINSAGTASPASTAAFSISPVAAPLPVSPVGGDILAQPQDPPLLVWAGTQGAAEYTVQVDKEGDWIGALEYKTQTTSLVVPDPLEAAIGAEGTTYFWRVKAKRASGIESAWSDEASFAVKALDQVAIVSPNDSPDNEIEDVVLDWAPVPGAQYYELRVATNEDFTNIVETRTKIYGTRYSPPVTYKNNQYYWQVRAVDLSGNPTDWSQIQANFSRVWPDTPQPLFPAAAGVETVSTDPYFQWSPVQHASQYELQVGANANFSPGTYDSCMTAGTTYTPYAFSLPESPTTIPLPNLRPDEDCIPTPGSTTYWRVRPLDRPQSGTPAWVLGLFSATQSFVYDPAAETNFSPANGSTVAIPTMSWDQITGAQSYRLSIQDRFGTVVKSNITTNATSYTPVATKLDPADGPFDWFLTAYNADRKPITLTFRHTFNLAGAFPTTAAAPLTPLSGTSTTQLPPQLSWEPMPGADSYRIVAGPAGTGTSFAPVSGDALEKKLSYPRVTDTWSWFLTPGDYDWQVKAYDASGQPIGSGPIATFTIAPSPAAQGTRIAIDGLSLDSDQACSARIGEVPDSCADIPTTPVFDWDPVPGAALYMLYLSEDANFTNLVEPLSNVPATSNTMWAPTLSSVRAALPDSQAGDAYYWYVRPCKSTKDCGPSPVSQVAGASNKFRKRSPAVASTSPGVVVTPPANPVAPEVTTTEVVFDWADYFDTNRAFTWSATGEKSPQAAMQYRIQVNDSPTFSMTASLNVDDMLVDQSTYTAFAELYPEAQLYWRVQAIDAEGNGLSWSDTRTFVKKSPAVQLSLPAEGSSGSGTRAFEWVAQPFAGSYQIEVAKNDDRNFSTTNRLFPIKSVKQTAYSWNLPIPASNQAYWWRVRRVDPRGNPGQWSTPRSFFSTGATPSLQAPANASQQPNNGPLFTWSEVTGATAYDLEVRPSGSSTNWVKITTAATSWATVKTVPDGSWQWRVTAKDASKNVLGLSGWGTFNVDFSRPVVKTWTPTTSMLRTKNFTATFSEPVSGVSGTTVRLYLGATKVRAKVTYNSSLRRATLNPSAYLKRGKTYTMKVSGAIRDAKGNAVVAKTWKVRIR